MMPLPNRYLTSLYVRCNGNGILIDCGEGTQVAMRRRGLSPHNVNTILLTHFHADHISGLPGMLLTMGNGERTEKVRIIGPKGIDRIISAVRTIAPELPFETECAEIRGNEDTFAIDGMIVRAFRVQHNTICYGYEIRLPRKGLFHAENAKALGIPLQYWNRLQKGETIEEDGRVYTPDMVLGPPRKGLKVVYATDTRPVPSINEAAKDADLLILEGMYGEEEPQEKAIAHRHMRMREAAEIAAGSGARELWLTHFSPSVIRPADNEEAVRGIFERTVIPKDGRSVTLRFPEEEE